MCENLHYESVYFKELHNEQEYYRPLRKWVIAWDQTKRTPVYGIVWGDAKQTWRKAKLNVAGLKKLKTAKRKVIMKEKKNMKMWS